MDRYERAAQARQLRRQGLSQQQIADRLGVSQMTISRYLKDAPPSKVKRRPRTQLQPRTIDAMLAEMTADERRQLAIRILTARTADAPVSRGALDF